MMEFRFFHAYRRLSDRGIIPPLSCKQCGGEYIFQTDGGIEPRLHCLSCNVTIEPGLKMYDEIKTAVEAHS